jgi:hypothetical protein
MTVCAYCNKVNETGGGWISQAVGGSSMDFCGFDCVKAFEAKYIQNPGSAVPPNYPTHGPNRKLVCENCGREVRKTKLDGVVNGKSRIFCCGNCMSAYKVKYANKSSAGSGAATGSGSSRGGSSGGAVNWFTKAATGTSGGPTMASATEHQLNKAGLGLAVGGVKLIAKGIMATEHKSEEELAKEAEYEAHLAQQEAEKQAVFGNIKSIVFGKESTAVASDLNNLFDILSSYVYELDFPYGPKGICLGVMGEERYKKEIWDKAEKHIAKGIEHLRKLGDMTLVNEFTTRLQEERDKVDKNKVKERLLAEKAMEAQKKAEEKEAVKQANAEKRAETMEKMKSFGSKAASLFGDKDATKQAAENALGSLTDKLNKGLGGLGGLFGKKK